MTNKFTAAPPAKYAPVRDHTRASEGAEIARVARAMGKYPMPWQQQVWDIGTEYIERNGVREYIYHTVIVVVSRQAGKTTLLAPKNIHRALTKPNWRGWFTAQTGKDAGKRVRDVMTMVTDSAILSPHFQPRYSNGDLGITCIASRGRFAAFAPTNNALHGETIDSVDIDEFWAFTEDQGAMLMGAIRPAMITKGNATQLWLVSTQGTAESTFMKKMVDLGRANTPGIAYFEWSAPADMEPYDLDRFAEFHPAFNNTITKESLQRDAESLPAGEWTRAYCNLITAASDPIISAEDWARLADENMQPPLEFTMGLEVAPGGVCAAVTGSWWVGDVPHTRVLHLAPGVDWTFNYIVSAYRKYAPTCIVVDGAGPVTRVADWLERHHSDEIVVRRLTIREYGAGCEEFLHRALETKTLRHDGSEALSAAVAAAELRVTNGVRTISRGTSMPVPALIASIVSLYAARATPIEADTFVI